MLCMPQLRRSCCWVTKTVAGAAASYTAMVFDSSSRNALGPTGATSTVWEPATAEMRVEDSDAPLDATALWQPASTRRTTAERFTLTSRLIVEA